MKRTLLICHHYPQPVNVGTNMRTMNFVRYFRDFGPIDIVYSNLLPGGAADDSSFSGQHFLRREKHTGLGSRVRRWASIGNRPLPVARYERESERFLLSLIETNDYDYILVRYAINAWNLFKLSSEYRARTIIDFDDIVSDSLYRSQISSASGRLRRWRFRLNRKFLVDFEKKCLDFGASLFCSETDMTRVAGGKGRRNSFIVPNIYRNEDFEDYDFGDGYGNGHVLLFVGSLNYEPNVSGLRWFIESVFPFFRKEFPGAQMIVAGRSPSRELRHLCSNTPGVELKADVPDMREVYRHCSAVIVPLLAGGGTRIKILEAALACRPLLSTPVGAEGLLFQDKSEVLLFQDAEEFSAAYAKLLDSEQYRSIAGKAKDITVREYLYPNFGQAMNRVISHLEAASFGLQDARYTDDRGPQAAARLRNGTVSRR
jgi:polysaccharide biosynthesis protein PslH